MDGVTERDLDAAAAAELLREQLRFVRGRSPLYERILAGLAGAAERGFDGGVVPRLLAVTGPAGASEARLLLLAALHHAALRDTSLPHAAWYPTAVAEPRPAEEGAPAALALAHLIEHEDEVAAFIAQHRLQTNEIGRCAALLPGFLAAAEHGMPLRLFEAGCSAGLNLRFDRYRYDFRAGPSWGPTSGPILTSSARGAVPESLVPPTVEVAERRGVDLSPIDPSTDEGARLLTAFIWPDDAERRDRLRRAIEVAEADPVRLEAGDLVAWTDEAVRPVAGTTTVLFHSLVVHLLDESASTGFEAAAERALRRGSSDAPVVLVRLEAPPGLDSEPELTIATGRGSAPPSRRTIATCDWHGRWVRWW